MAKLCFEVKDCLDCPRCISQRTPTPDSFEIAYDYFCEASGNKKIAGYIEWRSEMPPVPSWCTHLIKEKSNKNK